MLTTDTPDACGPIHQGPTQSTREPCECTLSHEKSPSSPQSASSPHSILANTLSPNFPHPFPPTLTHNPFNTERSAVACCRTACSYPWWATAHASPLTLQHTLPTPHTHPPPSRPAPPQHTHGPPKVSWCAVDVHAATQPTLQNCCVVHLPTLTLLPPFLPPSPPPPKHRAPQKRRGVLWV
jgi:hypothetical protein